MISLKRAVPSVAFGFLMLSINPFALADSPTHRIIETIEPAQSEIFPTGSTNDPPMPVFFGSGMALDGNTLLLGEPGALHPHAVSFTRKCGSSPWVRSSLVDEPKAIRYGQFGSLIALDGDTALVGTSTVVHVFRRQSDGWHKIQKIKRPPADSLTRFPQALALDSGVAVITASARGGPDSFAYIYEKQSDGTFALKARFLALADADYGGFGASAAVHEGTVAVGAPEGGSVFLFRRSGNTWIRAQEVMPIDVIQRYSFGQSVALDGNTLAVGTPHTGVQPGAGGLGAVYIFSLHNGIYTERDVLRPTADEHPNYDEFGHLVRMTHDRLVVAAHEATEYPWQDRESLVFTYVRSGSTMTPLGIARGVHNEAWNIATDGKQLIVSATTDIFRPIGTVYVYDIRTAQ